MNIFKNKKLIVMALTFVIFMALVQPPLLTAKERRGSTVVVTLTDDRMVRGELLAVKADALLVYDYKGEHLDLQQVAKVKILRKSKHGLGLLIGLGFGLMIRSGYKDNHDILAGLVYYFGPPIVTLCGGIIGAQVSAPKKLFLAGESPLTLEENLNQLKRYAREQEFEEPAAD